MPSYPTAKTECAECPKAVKNTITYILHTKGFHLPECNCESNFILFLMRGEIQIKSLEYGNITLKEGEFILQSICSRIELLALSDSECIYYNFENPELFCTKRYQHIMDQITVSSVISPLRIVPELKHYLEASKSYLKDKKICRDLLSLKNKELAFIIGYHYTNLELATLLHPLSHYTHSFQYFVLQNYQKVKTVEEFAQLGNYSVTTFRRIFRIVFHEPVYEWIMEQRQKNILYELHHTETSISEICYKYGFESLSPFSNFCKKKLGASPRKLRNPATFPELPLQELRAPGSDKSANIPHSNA